MADHLSTCNLEFEYLSSHFERSISTVCAKSLCTKTRLEQTWLFFVPPFWKLKSNGRNFPLLKNQSIKTARLSWISLLLRQHLIGARKVFLCSSSGIFKSVASSDWPVLIPNCTAQCVHIVQSIDPWTKEPVLLLFQYYYSARPSSNPQLQSTDPWTKEPASCSFSLATNQSLSHRNLNYPNDIFTLAQE